MRGGMKSIEVLEKGIGNYWLFSQLVHRDLSAPLSDAFKFVVRCIRQAGGSVRATKCDLSCSIAVPRIRQVSSRSAPITCGWPYSNTCALLSDSLKNVGSIRESQYSLSCSLSESLSESLSGPGSTSLSDSLSESSTSLSESSTSLSESSTSLSESSTSLSDSSSSLSSSLSDSSSSLSSSLSDSSSSLSVISGRSAPVCVLVHKLQ